MLRFPALITLVAAVAGPAMARTTIRPGQSVKGALTASDPTLDDGSPSDCFVVPTRQGRRFQIDQTPDAFDSIRRLRRLCSVMSIQAKARPLLERGENWKRRP